MPSRTLRLVAVSMGLSALSAPPAIAQTGYTYQTMPAPTANFFVRSVKDNLTFVANVSGGGNLAYIWNTSGGFSTYTYPGSSATQFFGLNDAGYILGGETPPLSGGSQGFLLFGGSTSPVSYAQVGLTNDFKTTGSSFGTGFYAFIYQITTNTLTTFTVPGTTLLTTFGINDDGQVVGNYETSSGTFVNFIRNADGSMTNFTIPGTTSYISLNGIANGPLVVGYYGNDDGSNTGFVRNADGSVATLNVPGTTRAYATAISNSGVVAGTATTTSGSWVVFFAYPPGYTGPKLF